MVFQSSAVSLEWNGGNLVLRRGQSTLVINPENVQSLRTQDSKQSFVEYWNSKALQNRAARRVFEAWERKDPDLLVKIYGEMTS